jgi:hypothetical protein
MKNSKKKNIYKKSLLIFEYFTVTRKYFKISTYFWNLKLFTNNKKDAARSHTRKFTA